MTAFREGCEENKGRRFLRQLRVLRSTISAVANPGRSI